MTLRNSPETGELQQRLSPREGDRTEECLLPHIDAAYDAVSSHRRYKRRWLIEHFWAWIQWQRRMLVGWEYYAGRLLGLVQLASIAALLRRS